VCKAQNLKSPGVWQWGTTRRESPGPVRVGGVKKMEKRKEKDPACASDMFLVVLPIVEPNRAGAGRESPAKLVDVSIGKLELARWALCMEYFPAGRIYFFFRH